MKFVRGVRHVIAKTKWWDEFSLHHQVAYKELLLACARAQDASDDAGLIKAQAELKEHVDSERGGECDEDVGAGALAEPVPSLAKLAQELHGLRADVHAVMQALGVRRAVGMAGGKGAKRRGGI